MNFEIFSNQWFKLGFEYFLRIYQVQKLKSGKFRLVNVLNGNVLFEALETTLTIDELQEIVFNRHCVCDLENELPNPFKYFDLSFDESFE